MDIDTNVLKRTLSEISNRIYVTDGVLKDRFFVDICRLLAIQIRSEKDSKCQLMHTNYINTLTEDQLNNWSKDLLDYAIKTGIDTNENAAWNIKPISIHWAAIRLSRFKLSEFGSDVKGEAFQQLVVNNLRGDRGEYFTPEPLVKTLCSIVELGKNSTVFDPACGSGGFLYGAYLQGVDPSNLFGIEFGKDVALAAKLRLGVLGGNSTQITCANAFEEFTKHKELYDVVLMNPPFGSKTKVDNLNILSQFEVAHLKSQANQEPKPTAPEVLFLELALRTVKQNGYVGTVIPDGILQNSSHEIVRNWLRSKANIMAVISCPTTTFIPYGTGVKTSILVLKKKPVRKKSDFVYFGISKNVGYDVRGNTIYQKDKFDSSSKNVFFEPVIQEDFTEIVKEYKELLSKNSQKQGRFGNFIESNKIKARWDSEFYQKNESDYLDKFQGNPKLGAICEIITKKVKIKELMNEQNYIAISDVDARCSQIVNIQLLDASELPSRASFIARESDVITATSGASTGTLKHASAIIRAEHDGSLISSGFALLRPFAVSKFQLLGYLRSELFLRQVKRLRTGHAIPAISADSLMEIFIPKLDHPIWREWELSMRELDQKAQHLFQFADLTRNSQATYVEIND